MKIDYELTYDGDYVDVTVYYKVGHREWYMNLYRDRQTLCISKPTYMYAPNIQEPFDDVPRLPKRVQAHFDRAMPKAKTILILGSN